MEFTAQPAAFSFWITAILETMGPESESYPPLIWPTIRTATSKIEEVPPPAGQLWQKKSRSRRRNCAAAGFSRWKPGLLIIVIVGGTRDETHVPDI